MADPNPPGTGASIPLVTHTSNMRTGDLLAEGEYVSERNATITKKDNEGNDITETYVLRTFHTNEAFVNEKRAYERMREIPALSGRVPAYHGTTYVPDSILLGQCEGSKLEDIIWTLSNEARASLEWKVTELLQILHKAGVAHCNITSKDIIISDNGDVHVQLVNFWRANRREYLEEGFMWDNCQDMDKHDVMEIFHEVESAKAQEEATHIVESVRNGATLAMPQTRLAHLLPKMGGPEMELLRSIMDVFKNPEPALALQLADRLVHRDEHDEAIEMLTQAAARFDNSKLPSSHLPIEKILQMKINAARYEMDAERDYEGNDLPPSNGRCEEAVRYYLSSTEKASPADNTVVKLRYELAEHFFDMMLGGYAIDVCVRALEGVLAGVIEPGREVSLDFLQDYGTLIKNTKKMIAYDIKDIKEDMQKGGDEHSWRPWAELPMHEQAHRRVEEAERLLKDIRAKRPVPKGPVKKIAVVPPVRGPKF